MGLVKVQILIQQEGGGAWESAFPASSQMLHMPLVQGKILREHEDGYKGSSNYAQNFRKSKASASEAGAICSRGAICQRLQTFLAAYLGGTTGT